MTLKLSCPSFLYSVHDGVCIHLYWTLLVHIASAVKDERHSDAEASPEYVAFCCSSQVGQVAAALQPWSVADLRPAHIDRHLVDCQTEVHLRNCMSCTENTVKENITKSAQKSSTEIFSIKRGELVSRVLHPTWHTIGHFDADNTKQTRKNTQKYTKNTK